MCLPHGGLVSRNRKQSSRKMPLFFGASRMLKFEVCLHCYIETVKADGRFMPSEDYFCQIWKKQNRCVCPHFFWERVQVKNQPPHRCPYLLEHTVWWTTIFASIAFWIPGNELPLVCQKKLLRDYGRKKNVASALIAWAFLLSKAKYLQTVLMY